LGETKLGVGSFRDAAKRAKRETKEKCNTSKWSVQGNGRSQREKETEKKEKNLGVKKLGPLSKLKRKISVIDVKRRKSGRGGRE